MLDWGQRKAVVLSAQSAASMGALASTGGAAFGAVRGARQKSQICRATSRRLYHIIANKIL